MKVGTGFVFYSFVIVETNFFHSLSLTAVVWVVLLTQLVQMGHMLWSSL